MEDYSVYLHIPFCQRRCNYCDFNTYSGASHLIHPYIKALIKEVMLVAQSAPADLKVGSVYFGGGTPSVLPLSEWRDIFQSLNANFSIRKGAEISVEVNPGTVREDLLGALKDLGVNRLSIGMQSAANDELKLLGRIHTFNDVRNTVAGARQAGFDNINLDLIYGIPGQTIKNWQSSLECALDLKPEHFSLYAITLEEEVPLQRWIEEGRFPVQDDDLMAEMYEWASTCLEQSGYVQYEISNWAKLESTGTERACRHNLQYWRNLPYLGLGAGAHGSANHYRTENVRQIDEYIQRMDEAGRKEFPFSQANERTSQIDRWTEIQETLMVGLRLTGEGISRMNFGGRFGVPIEDYFGREIQNLVDLGLLEYAGENQDILRLTRRGRFISNQVFIKFIGKRDPEQEKFHIRRQ